MHLKAAEGIVYIRPKSVASLLIGIRCCSRLLRLGCGSGLPEQLEV